jgi:hypothetical protein
MKRMGPIRAAHTVLAAASPVTPIEQSHVNRFRTKRPSMLATGAAGGHVGVQPLSAAPQPDSALPAEPLSAVGGRPSGGQMVFSPRERAFPLKTPKSSLDVSPTQLQRHAAKQHDNGVADSPESGGLSPNHPLSARGFAAPGQSTLMTRRLGSPVLAPRRMLSAPPVAALVRGRARSVFGIACERDAAGVGGAGESIGVMRAPAAARGGPVI